VALEPPELVTAVIRLLSGVLGGPASAEGNWAGDGSAAGSRVTGDALTGGGR
jgi:hypothetical protein